jgi:hypothetical protein
MNLLEQMHDGGLSPAEAESIFDAWQERFHAGEVSTPWNEQFEFSEFEATAFLHGATLGDLVKLRYEGWPTKCRRCGRDINYRLYGWVFIPPDDEKSRLEHIFCGPHMSNIET